MFTEDEIKRKRVRIHRKMLKSGTTPDLKEGKPDLRRLFELYDKIFFKGHIQKKLDETNSTLGFTFSKHTKTGGTCSRKGCEWKINIPLKLFQGLFQKGEKNLRSCGIWCTSKLDCLQLTFEHELIHLLMQLYEYQDKKPEYNQPPDTFRAHGRLFQCMVFLYFGHTDYKHDLFLGEASTKIKKEDVRPGVRIKFFSSKTQEEYYGQIAKINPKKAVVILDDGREWGVPYSMLELSDRPIPDVPVPPKPSISAKDQFKVGMRVTYVFKGKDYYGVITRINPKRATIKEDGGAVHLMPYSILKESNEPHRLVLPGFNEPHRLVLPGYEEPEKKNIKDEIQVGDRVRVKWKYGDVRMGIIKKKNPVKAIILMEDGKNWNVRYQAILGKVSGIPQTPKKTNKVSEKPVKTQFKVGQDVYFKSKSMILGKNYGVIASLTPPNAVIVDANGIDWTIPINSLEHPS